MNRQSTKKALILPFVIMTLTAIALVVVWFVFNQLVAGIATIVLVIIIIGTAFMVRQALQKLDSYVDNLSGHISEGSNIAIKNLPIGMIILDENENIEWMNRFMSERLNRNVISDPVNEVYPNILKQLEKTQEIEINENEYHYRVRYSEKEHVLYFFDITKEFFTNELYESSNPIIATLFLYNYDEIPQNMYDTQKS